MEESLVLEREKEKENNMNRERERGEKITHITFFYSPHFLGLENRNGFWGSYLYRKRNYRGKIENRSSGTVILNSDTFNK